MNKKNCEIDIARLQERDRAMEEILKEIKDNHLPHINEELCKLNEKVNAIDVKLAYYAGGVAIIVFIAQQLAKYIDL